VRVEESQGRCDAELLRYAPHLLYVFKAIT
jgi:hypothetical protein